VAARVLLALCAVLVLVWVGVLFRDYETGREAAIRSFFQPQLSEAARGRDLQLLEDAQLLDPSAYWELAQTNLYLAAGQDRRAAKAAESLVGDEPENIFAWSALRQATRDADPRRSAEAAAEIERLNPLGSR
jgi:hypothetical protein